MHAKKNAKSTAIRNGRIVEKDLNSYIGDRPIAEISAPELLAVLRKMEKRGAVETAHRARGIVRSAFSQLSQEPTSHVLPRVVD